jgi:hypothetical protein
MDMNFMSGKIGQGTARLSSIGVVESHLAIPNNWDNVEDIINMDLSLHVSSLLSYHKVCQSHYPMRRRTMFSLFPGQFTGNTYTKTLSSPKPASQYVSDPRVGWYLMIESS